MSEQTSEFYEFGNFQLKSGERVLLRGHDLVSLAPKAFDILLTLLENDGRIVPKEDLMKRVWPNTFVEEGNLTQNVSLLRKALGESANGPQFIETVPRRGYRFVAPVSRSTGNGGPSLVVDVVSTPRDGLAPPLIQQNQPTLKRGLWTLDSGPGTSLSRRVPLIALTLVVVVAGVAGIAYLSTRNEAGAAPTAIQSIAVLPFVDDSPGGDA